MKKLAMITVILLVAVMTFSFSDDLYRMLTRYPEKVEKTSFDFKGEVLQWEERNHYNIYRIATKPTKYYDGYSGNVVIFLVAPTVKFEKFIEGDIVEISNAIYKGVKTYETIFGQMITLPFFEAKFWTKGTYE